MTKLNKQLAAGSVALVLAGLVIWRLVTAGPQPDQDPNAPVPVVLGQVTARDVPLTLTGIGTVQAYNTVTIRARVDGELVKVAFREGQDVKKGDLLAQIDPRPYQAALDNAQATLAKDTATLANAKRDLARYEETAAKGYSSVQQLDTQKATVNSLVAAVQGDQAMVENARVQLGYTSIVSPLDGRTGVRLVDQGNIVHATDTTGLVIITQLQPISAIFTLSQDSLPPITTAMKKGALAATAYSRDVATKLDQGVLELVDNQIDPTTGTARLKAQFPNTDNMLWPGQFINVRLEIGAVHNGITVATRAVQRGQNGTYVYVLKPDSTVDVRMIQIGQQDEDQTLVTKGLKAGEQVVLDGQLRLQPGAKVHAVTAAAASGTGKNGAGNTQE